jgi:hypothetical protein
MRKLTALVFAVALVVGMATLANAQKTYTWQLIESPSAFEVWPNQADSPSLFEANGGLLGRVNTQSILGVGGDVFAATAGSCEMAPSYDCESGSPPAFLLPTGTAEPATNFDSECNRQTTACNSISVVSNSWTIHGGHSADPPGEYSFMVIHTSQEGTEPGGKGISFFSGSYSAEVQPYTCNDCPPVGMGKDQANQYALHNTGAGAVTHTTDVSMWGTQSSAPFGHFSLKVNPAAQTPGIQSVCGSGIQFNSLYTDLCIDGTSPTGNFEIVDQKLVIQTYDATDLDVNNVSSHWASATNVTVCNPPDCYVQNVILPAAVAQAPGACGSGGVCAIQTQVATTILPSTAPGALEHATVDTLLFALTTQKLDADGDGVQDGNDPCPNDATDACTFDILASAPCPAGEVFCLDQGGATASCKKGALCDTRLDVDQSCNLRPADTSAIFNSLAFNIVDIGPFDP